MVSPQRWQRIKDLFNSALARSAAERQQFLSEACNDDQSIREEVESLLFEYDEDDSFLSAPAYEMASEMLAKSGAELRPGDQIGPYTMLSSLGLGGMGEVYLAQDSRLGRKIAIKLLAPKFASDELRVQRFELEARAASALNHPNVCVIHDVGRAENGRHFMAMEYVEGTTLRQRMNESRLSLKQALDIAAQVAWALEAAHAAGIVHRDIKPENIMLRPDGFVKVLDFGIAKLNAQAPKIRDARQNVTVDRLQTAPGMLMGTVKYMSPEQLRELPIDPRSDIWTLGVVLHEMVTGYTPFEAATTNETIAVILERQPARLYYSDRVPEEVRQLIRKAVNKRRRDRYQTMHEFSAELRKLRRHVSKEVVSEVLGQPEILGQPTLSYETSPVGELEATDVAAASTFARLKSQAVSTATYLVSEIREHKRAAVFAGGTAIFALLFYGFDPFGWISKTEPNQTSPQTQTTAIKPITNAGQSVCAAISPDGRFVAHVGVKDGMQELVITRTVNLATSTVVPRSDAIYRSLTFSPDGYYLYFTRDEKNANVLYQVALPVSAPRKIKSGVDSPISFSPNGDRFAFVRYDRRSSEYFLIVDEINGGAERTIATRRSGNRFAEGPSWSPDGKSLACGSGWWNNGYHMNLVEIDIESGQEKLINGREWSSIQQVVWRPDKRGLIIAAREQPISPFQIWWISYPEGDTTRVTTDTIDYQNLSMSRDGTAIVAVQSYQNARLWISSIGDDANARPITSTVGLAYGVVWTKQGKIVFSSMAGDNLNIWRIDPDGSNQTQLTVNAGDNYTPATTADERFIVFSSNRNGSFNIWRMRPDGADQQQLTFDDGNSYPSCSPDNQWFAYDNQSRNPRTIWKAPLDGGTPVQLTSEYARMPVFSPDNRFIACRYVIEPDLLGIAILPSEGGTPVKLLRIPIRDWQRIQWIENGRALSYIDVVDGVSNIWSYDLDTEATKQLTHFKSDQIFSYAWSPDFKQLATQRGTTVSDVTIINHVK